MRRTTIWTAVLAVCACWMLYAAPPVGPVKQAIGPVRPAKDLDERRVAAVTIPPAAVLGQAMTNQQRLRIVLGALTNANGSAFVDAAPDTLARRARGIAGGALGPEQLAKLAGTEQVCGAALNLLRRTLKHQIATHEANVAAKVAADAEAAKVQAEVNFGTDNSETP